MLINEVASQIQSKLATRAKHIRFLEQKMTAYVTATKSLVAKIDDPSQNQDGVHGLLAGFKQEKQIIREQLAYYRKQQKLDKENLRAAHFYESYLRFLNMKKH